MDALLHLQARGAQSDLIKRTRLMRPSTHCNMPDVAAADAHPAVLCQAGRTAEAADAHTDLVCLLWNGRDGATAMQLAHSLARQYMKLGRIRLAIAVQVRDVQSSDCVLQHSRPSHGGLTHNLFASCSDGE